MPLNSIQQHVLGLLDGLAMTSYPQQPLKAYVAPPVPDNMTHPRLYIWGANFDEARQTAPRGPGFKKTTYELDLWLFTVENPNSTGIGERFPVLIDQVQGVLRTTEMPIEITDPTTGVVSQLLSIGEKFTVRYDTERSLTDQRLVRFLALITAPIEEAIVG